MTKKSPLIAEIVEYAREQGLNQKELASRAHLPEETVSRAKTRGRATLEVTEALAAAAGAKLILAGPRRATTLSRDFRTKHGVALAWSDRNAPDDVLIRQALLQPRFQVLLDAAVTFGLDKLKGEWMRLRAEESPEALKARPATERMLAHLDDGYLQATA